MMTNHSFFALAFRMKNIGRWGLMRSSREENLTEHCAETAMIAHALALIGNKNYGRTYDARRVMCLALYHDLCEVYTGDMPTPVKYFNSEMRESYRKIELASANKLISKLPSELREEYEKILLPDKEDSALREELALVKAADKLSALIKCMEELNQGNTEFRTAYQSTKSKIDEIDLPEVKYFCEAFLPSFSLTLDEM